jgi:WD40 repeat protein
MPSCLLLEETALHDGYGIPVLVTKRAPGWGVRETILEAESVTVCIAYASHGKLIASISYRPVIRVWDVATGTSIHMMSVPDAEVDAGSYFTSIAFSPNSQWIASASTDRTVRLWDVVTGSQRHVMRGHTNSVNCVAFSPDGTVIVSGSYDDTLRIWDVGTGTERRAMMGHTAAVTSLAFAPDGQAVISASRDGTLRLWEVLTGTELRVIEGDGGILYCVAFSSDGSTIASGSYGNLQLWSTTNGTRQHALNGHFDDVRSLAVSPDGRSILSCDGIGLARIWDVTTGIEKTRLREDVTVVTYSPDGKSIAMGLGNGTIRIRDANISASDAAHLIPEDHHSRGSINSVTFSPDGVLVAFSSADQTIRIWDATTLTERLVMEAGDTIYSLTFSPDNRTIACGQSNGAVQLREVTSGQKKCYMMGRHGIEVDSVAFSPNGKLIVSYSSSNGIAQVWDVATGVEQHRLTYTGTLYRDDRIMFSADGKTAILLDGFVARGFWDLTLTQPEYVESTSPHEQMPDFHGSKQHHFGGAYSAWIWHFIGEEEQDALCWLPQGRRAVGGFAYSGTRVCVGGEDGTLTILDFSHVDIVQHGV